MNSESSEAIYIINNQEMRHEIASNGTNIITNNANIGNSNTFNPLAMIEHLQQTLRKEQTRRIELEKELSNLKIKYSDLQRKFFEQQDEKEKNAEFQQNQLENIKQRLYNTLRATYEDNFFISKDINKKIDYIHECDECTFKTKSNVSLILHKMNHKIKELQYQLSTSSFTTRNSNSKSIYKCSACDTGDLTRHQVYRHIYDVHTNEKPISCSYCELSFTHKDYFEKHLSDKHDKMVSPKKLSNSSNILSSSSMDLNPMQQSLSNNKNNDLSQTFTFKSYPPESLKSNKRYLSSPLSTNDNFKCTFPDCNFSTVSPDKLDFHMKAHINTKYKCPYCPYVSNTIVDIKRHIQKSKKHEGLKMYSCQNCNFAADCDRSFREHLRSTHFGYNDDNLIEYFIQEMFSNKNKRTDNEENNLETIVTISNEIINSNKESNGTNDNPSTEITGNNLIIQSQQPNAEMLPQLKKVAGSKLQHIRLINIDSSEKHQSGNQLISQNASFSVPTPTTTANIDTHQSLNIHLTPAVTTNQNSLIYHGIELEPVTSTSCLVDSLQFVSTSDSSNNHNQHQTEISIPISAITMAHSDQHSHHQTSLINQNQHHNSGGRTLSTIISNNNIMPEGFLQTALNQALVTSQTQQSISSNSSQTHNGANLSVENTTADVIPITQYVSYANY